MESLPESIRTSLGQLCFIVEEEVLIRVRRCVEPGCTLLKPRCCRGGLLTGL